MKLQSRFLLSLLAGSIGVYGVSQVAGYFRTASILDDSAHRNLQSLAASELDWVEKLIEGDHALFSAMAEGENKLVEEIIQTRGKTSGVLEFSLHDRNGVVTLSSDSRRIHQSLPPELKTSLLSSTEPVKRRVDGAFEFYRPIAVTPACLECHANFKNSKVGGVLTFRYSTAGLLAAETRWQGLASDLKHSTLVVTLATAAALVGALALLIVWLVQRQIARPIQEVTAAIAAGAEQVHAEAESITDGSNKLAGGASEQAAALEESSASLEEMASMTKINATNAANASKLAAEARQAADHGVRDIVAMNNAIGDLKASSDGISQIIKTIDEIAFQTNILALNAAVEAARAGEAGAGFAVVANEVRSLAQRSAHAARETAEKIAAAIGKTNQGVKISEQVGASLAAIVEKVRGVDELVSQVATASGEQSRGVDQVNGAVREMDVVTQANAAAAEESSATSEQLNAQAGALCQAVATLQELISGTTSTRSSVSERRAARPHSTARPSTAAKIRPAVKIIRRELAHS